MTEVLTTFPKLIDPYTGAPLMERMALIANTSNMPVAAREASVVHWDDPRGVLPRHGVQRGPHGRFDVAMGRGDAGDLEPARRDAGEEGFPAYLSSRLSEFYERAGRVTTLSDREGSVSVVGAVSPSGGLISRSL